MIPIGCPHIRFATNCGWNEKATVVAVALFQFNQIRTHDVRIARENFPREKTLFFHELLPEDCVSIIHQNYIKSGRQ